MDASTLDVLATTPPDGIDADQDVAPNAWGGIARSPKRIKAILALSDAGKTQTDIAKIIGISQAEVSRTLRDWTPVTELAKRRVDALQLDAVESLAMAMGPAAKKGLHGPQSALLEAGGLLRAHEKAQQVVIQVGAQTGDVQVGILVQTSGPSPTDSPVIHSLSAEESGAGV